MTKLTLIQTATVVLAAGVLLAGCTAGQSQPAATSTAPAAPAAGTVKAEDKVGNTTLSGTISKVGDQYMLTAPGQPTKGLDSYKIDLSQYVGKAVKVTGQYSGDTLFVSVVE